MPLNNDLTLAVDLGEGIGRLACPEQTRVIYKTKQDSLYASNVAPKYNHTTGDWLLPLVLKYGNNLDPKDEANYISDFVQVGEDKESHLPHTTCREVYVVNRKNLKHVDGEWHTDVRKYTLQELDYLKYAPMGEDLTVSTLRESAEWAVIRKLKRKSKRHQFSKKGK